MSPRNTRTGATFERIIIPALEDQASFYEFFARGQRTARRQRTKDNPRRLPDPFRSGHTHVLDILVRERASGAQIGISVKWQQSWGTAEEKVAFEFLRIIKFVEREKLDRGYIVLGGGGWTLKEYFLSPDFPKEFSSPKAPKVSVIDIDTLITKINTRSL